jgi:hypothetical protein
VRSRRSSKGSAHGLELVTRLRREMGEKLSPTAMSLLQQLQSEIEVYVEQRDTYEVQKQVCIHVCMCVFVCVYVCMYACMYIHASILLYVFSCAFHSVSLSYTLHNDEHGYMTADAYCILMVAGDARDSFLAAKFKQQQQRQAEERPFPQVKKRHTTDMCLRVRGALSCAYHCSVSCHVMPGT